MRDDRPRALLTRIVTHDLFVPWVVGLLLGLGTLTNYQLGVAPLPAFYGALQAFATGMDISLDRDAERLNPWWDTLGWMVRLVAPIASATVLVKAAHVLGWFRRPLFTFRDHVIVIGAGQVGTALATQFVEAGRRVILVERDADNRNLGELEALGVRTIIADGTSEAALRRARVEQAVALVATTREDLVNMDATYLAAASATSGDAGAALRCYAHVVDHVLRAPFTEVCRARDLPVKLFSMYDYAAAHVCDTQLRALPTPPALVVVAGFGRFGEAVFTRLAEEMRAGRCQKCLVVDRDPARRQRFEHIRGDLPAERADIYVGDMLDIEVATRIRASAHPSLVLICTDDDVRNLELAFILGGYTGEQAVACEVVTRMFRWPEGSATRQLFSHIGGINIDNILQERFAAEVASLPRHRAKR